MSINTYIKFAGIDGESTSQDHKGEIDVLSWNWNVSVPTGAGGGGSGAGKATPHDFTFIHVYDKASPLLAKSAASLKRCPTAVLTARKAGEGQKDFLKVTMKEVLITSVSPSGADPGLSEVVSLSYSDIEFAYKPQDSKGGLGGEVRFDWNVKTGQVT